MLQRNLLYTAMTRGKELFVLIGTPEAIDQAVRTVGTLTRYTALNYELAEVKRILDKLANPAFPLGFFKNLLRLATTVPWMAWRLGTDYQMTLLSS